MIKARLGDVMKTFGRYTIMVNYEENDLLSLLSPDKLDESGHGGDTLPSQPSGRKEYKRYGMFVTWSQ